jgi:hypothetical protein
MKKIVNLTQSDLTKIVNRVLNETETTEMMAHTQKSLRHEAVFLLKNLGIKTEDETVSDVADMIKFIIQKYGGKVLD